ncbi:MAG TPA: NUDIX hydrolase [Candidatus Obscuribacter sp.]|nr:NUDIX hydrolase [Candidatus Obscuribacter sp.]HMX45840.1 NUDIX hydrolase [Candidatus Obscuribacter sp.]HNA73466.1 NUDIX hydrolase [Candidatus Obscuribacter sp.]HNB17724.1 NUDIX hydrolase [Candidatus Obscuribacter sp.]
MPSLQFQKPSQITMKSCPHCTAMLKVTGIGGKDRLACELCEFVHWDNPKPVTATLVTMDSELVLVKRKFEPFVDDWCLPGGFIEASEDPEESAAREVFEETGLEVRIEKLLGASAPGHGINVIILFYQGTPVGGRLEAGDDASAVGTFKPDSMPKNIAFPLHRKMISQFFQSVKSEA